MPTDRPTAARPATARVFFALWPPPAVADQLAALAADHANRAGGRATRRETIHLTLAFLGDVALERLPALNQAAASVRAEAFDLTLDRLGIWHHNRIFWVGCAAPAGLSALVLALREALTAAGFKLADGDRKFSPHVTLARKVALPDAPLPAFAPLAWRCANFVLVRSSVSGQSSSYRTIGEFRLGNEFS
ncbi:RNA 2',3'-cyclic phosphodiesterase [Dechloromonas sp. H13]|uniref:RNA 2',3'-cyclic phosphodiesterase n=1 Tax=Dechloromonas sp. H13 TaxID=2570193 RepID=UPI00129188A8|nr:RNA 2',3'-cyclic phosphodiesterase [Dechloromonas sp. H13]